MKSTRLPSSLRWRAAAYVCVVLGAMGCGRGAMNQVGTSRSGAADKGGLASALDAPLAVGGEVRPALQVEMRGAVGVSTHLIAARPDIVAVDNGLVRGRSPGTAAVLVAVDGDTVVDILHVTVRRPDRVALHAIDQAGGDLGPLTEPIELVTGDAIRLVPHVYADAEILSGVATSTWSVEPPIAVVLREGMPNRLRLVARAPGNALVKVSMLDQTSTLSLKVLP